MERTHHEVMTASEVARLAGVSVDTIRRHDAGLSPDRTESGTRIYRREVVERWIAERAARKGQP